MRRILPPLFLLLVSFLVFAANTAPEIHSIAEKNGVYEKEEGALFEFSVDASDAESDAITYSWNFGDGGDWLETSEPRAAHNYYFEAEPGETRREFTVTVSASDGKLQSAQSIKVTVKKSSWKIRLKEPAPTKRLEKNKPFELQVEVLSRTNRPQSTGSIRLTATLAGKELKMSKESKYFTANVSPDYSFNNTEILEVKARSGSRRSDTKIPLYFSPAQIAVKGNPLEEKDLFVGIPIGRINAGLAFGDGDVPMDGNFWAEVYSGKRRIARAKMTRKLDFYTTDINRALELEQFFNKNRLVIKGDDGHGNPVAENSFDINFRCNNPKFNIEIVNPAKSELGSFGAGQEVSITAKVVSSEEKAENPELSVFVPRGSVTKLAKTGQEFTGKVQLPQTQEKSIAIAVYGKAEVAGETVSAVKTLNLELSKKFEVSFVYPSQGNTVLQENGKTIIVSIRTPSGNVFYGKSVKGVLYVDGINQVLQFRKDPGTGNYSASLDKPLIGRHTLKLVIPERDGMSGLAEIQTNIVQGFDFLGILLIVLLVTGLGYSLWFVARKLKTPGLDLKHQIEKTSIAKPVGDYLKKEMKKLELEFYKRKISEEEFRERMLELKRVSRQTSMAAKPRPVTAMSELKIPPKKPIPPAKPEEKIRPSTFEKAPQTHEKRPLESLRERPSQPAEIAPRTPTVVRKPSEREEEHLRSVIEKRLSSEEGIQPLVVGREKTQPRPRQHLEPLPSKPSRTVFEKPKETISKAKIGEVRKKLAYMAEKGKLDKSKLSLEEEDAVKKLVLALEGRASAFTREEIFNSILKEGFSPRVARETVKRLFG